MTTHASNRRTLLKAAAATTLLAATAGADDTSLGWIDAHSHIWPAETDKYPLVAGLTKKDLDPPSFTDDELLAIAEPLGVKRVVLIQHSVFHLFDNSYLVDAIKRRPKQFRAVGMVDDHQSGAGKAMKRLLEQGVTGFRITPFIRKDAPEKWLDTPGMQEMWKTGGETRQAMCCLIDPKQLPGVAAMCTKYPDTPVVIDHFARIGATGTIDDADVKQLCELARHKNVFVKVSAYYALGKKRPPHDELLPMTKRLLETFGRERLMWASDSPYQLQRPNTYEASLRFIRDNDAFSQDDREWLLRKTAEKVYFFV